MKKFESFLRKYSWLLKLGIFGLLLVWAIKLPAGISYMISSNGEYTGKYDWRIDTKIRDEMSVFTNKLYLKDKDAANYDPGDYFEDLKTILLKERELRQKYNYASPAKHAGLEYSDVHSIRMLIDEKIRQRTYWAEMDEASKAFQDWQIQEGFLEKTDLEKNKEEFSIWTRTKLLPWAVGLYLKGVFLCLILFLTRMAQNDGILKTILSEKMKFFRVLIFWPKFIFDYPDHIIREIHVETELRRLGGIWRKLDPREQKLVKEIASRSKAEYKQWITDFRKENASSFARSFEWALVGTALILLSQTVAPVSANAEIRDCICVEQGNVYNEYNAHMNSPGDDLGSFSPDNVPMWAEEMFILPAPRSIQRIKVFFEKLKPKKLSRKIFIIPEFGYLVKDFILQTK